jgi:hypothetical protein
MCGFALSTKVLALVPISVLCVWVFLVCGPSKGWGRGFRSALILGASAIIVGSPWYIKAYLYTGNPVYPFLYNIFGGINWSKADADAYRGSQLAFGMGRSFRDFVLMPWNLASQGYRFFDFPSPVGLIGVGLLGLIPLHMFTRSLKKPMLKIASVGIVTVVAWFFLMQQSRYLIGVLPLFCIVAGTAVSAANEKWRWGRHVVNCFVVFCVAITLFVGLMMDMNCAKAAIGMESTDDYLSRTLDVYGADSFVNETLPADARLVLFDEVKGFYLNRDYIWGNPGHHEMIPWKSFKNGADMVGFLTEHGYTHAMVDWKSAGKDDVLHSKMIGYAIAHGLMQEIYSSRGIGVYEFVKPNALPHE